MPLIKKIKEKNYIIGIWKFNSSEYNRILCEKIHPDYHSDFLQYKMEKRKWEVYGTKLLFNELIPENELISENGIPYIKDSEKHVSITHTDDLVAMIIANYDCGIDIELKKRDASRIKHKFLNDRDFKHGDNKKEILKIWCMKEVLYKVKKVNKKVKKLAFAQTLSKKNNDKNLYILADVTKEIKKTKEFNKFLLNNNLTNTLIISDNDTLKNINKSARNIKNIKLIKDEGANIFDLLKFKNVLITSSSAKKIQNRILNEKN